MSVTAGSPYATNPALLAITQQRKLLFLQTHPILSILFDSLDNKRDPNKRNFAKQQWDYFRAQLKKKLQLYTEITRSNITPQFEQGWVHWRQEQLLKLGVQQRPRPVVVDEKEEEPCINTRIQQMFDELRAEQSQLKTSLEQWIKHTRAITQAEREELSEMVDEVCSGSMFLWFQKLNQQLWNAGCRATELRECYRNRSVCEDISELKFIHESREHQQEGGCTIDIRGETPSMGYADER